VILVSHDRELLRSLTTRVWMLHTHTSLDFAGSFGEWEQVSEARAHAAAIMLLKKFHSAVCTRGRKSDASKTKGRKTAVKRDARIRAADAEQTVLSLEAEIAKVSEALANPELYLTRDGAIQSGILGISWSV